MNYRDALGRWAEDCAELYVINELKMRVIGRNIRNEYGELDIIAIEPKRENFIITGNEHKLENIIRQRQNAKLDDELVIIEVRCRTQGGWETPLESVGPKKLGCLIRAGMAYKDKITWPGNWRIDLIGIELPRRAGGKPFCFDYVEDIAAGVDIDKFLKF